MEEVLIQKKEDVGIIEGVKKTLTKATRNVAYVKNKKRAKKLFKLMFNKNGKLKKLVFDLETTKKNYENKLFAYIEAKNNMDSFLQRNWKEFAFLKMYLPKNGIEKQAINLLYKTLTESQSRVLQIVKIGEKDRVIYSRNGISKSEDGAKLTSDYFEAVKIADEIIENTILDILKIWKITKN